MSRQLRTLSDLSKQTGMLLLCAGEDLLLLDERANPGLVRAFAVPFAIATVMLLGWVAIQADTRWPWLLALPIPASIAAVACWYAFVAWTHAFDRASGEYRRTRRFASLGETLVAQRPLCEMRRIDVVRRGTVDGHTYDIEVLMADGEYRRIVSTSPGADPALLREFASEIAKFLRLPDPLSVEREHEHVLPL